LFIVKPIAMLNHTNNSHLTDTQLQLHLEGQTLTANQQTHLANCPLCAQQLQLYQQMYVGFSQLPAPTLPFNLAQTIMQQLPHQAANTAPNTQPENAWVAATTLLLLIAVGIAAYLGLFKSIIPLLTNNTWAVAQLLTAVLATVLLFQWIEYRFWNSKMA
jgi:anti-sigma factor RsiW